MSEIFLSWSTEKSHACASAIGEYLRKIYTGYEPWISSSTIVRGATWFEEIKQALTSAKLGLFCLTPANYREPWMLFEAGALLAQKNGVKPVLFGGLTPGDVQGTPFAHIQLTNFNKKEISALMTEVNEVMGVRRLTHQDLEARVSVNWRFLHNRIRSALDTRDSEPEIAFKNADEKLDALLDYSGYIARHTKLLFKEESNTGLTIKLNKLLYLSVKGVGLPRKLELKLDRANITSIGELSQKTSDELLMYRGITTSDINAIVRCLDSLGLGLGYRYSSKIWSAKNPFVSYV